MRKSMLLSISTIISVLCLPYFAFSSPIEHFNTNTRQDVLSNDSSFVIKELHDGVIEDGVYKGVNNTKGLIDKKVSNSYDAREKTMAYAQKIFNYFLGIVGLLNLMYLVYCGVVMIISSGDEAKFKKGAQGLKVSVIVLFGLGTSWLFIRLIMFLIASFT